MAADGRGGVAAGHQLTADAGAAILRDGGTAVDAAIGAILAACVCEPVLVSPGGGGFMMIAAEDGPVCLDFFVDTPGQGVADRTGPALDCRTVEADFGTARQSFSIGAGTSAVPGVMPGLIAAHERYGRMPFSEVAAPAIALARDGFPMTRFQAYLSAVITSILTATPEAAELFGFGADGEPPAAGSIVRNPDLADALDHIAREGLRSVTVGDIATAMLADQHAGGSLSAADLAGYRPVWRQPAVHSIGSHRVYLNPPPAAGGTLIGTMIAENGSDPSAPALARAMAATDSAWTGAGRSIDRFCRQAGNRPSAPRGTTHVSVFDGSGMAVSVTTSNGEGNGLIVPGCGFMVNNMLGEDDVNPAGVDGWTPGIRLSSMMAPTVAVDGDGASVALGSGGSNRIRSAIYQVLMRHLAGDLPLEEAISAPRMHVEKGHLDFEDDFPSDERAALVAAFSDRRAWPEPSLFYGGVHGVRQNADGSFDGAGDKRRGGVFVAA